MWWNRFHECYCYFPVPVRSFPDAHGKGSQVYSTRHWLKWGTSIRLILRANRRICRPHSLTPLPNRYINTLRCTQMSRMARKETGFNQLPLSQQHRLTRKAQLPRHYMSRLFVAENGRMLLEVSKVWEQLITNKIRLNVTRNHHVRNSVGCSCLHPVLVISLSLRRKAPLP